MIKNSQFCEIARRLLRCPAVPYHEAAVRAEAEFICAQHGFLFELDKFGNLIVRLETAPAHRPLVLAAHLDHPGFEIVRALSSETLLARFLGGVPDDFFRPGIPLRLLPGPKPAVLGRRIGQGKEFEIRAILAGSAQKSRAAVARHDPETESPLLRASSAPRFAVWELEDFAVRRDRIRGRAC